MATHSNGRLGDKNEWEFPHLRESHQIPNTGDFWDVKFYPYTEPRVDTIFAVVGVKHILICRAPEEKHIDIILSIADDEPENENYSCAWSKNLESGTPLLCVGGRNGKIKIINALTGKLERVLIGHAGDINTLEISPINPYILASGCQDCTTRIWSLDPAHEKQPCAAILAGDGHSDTILSVSFHASGRYLLTSGADYVINLWVLPSFPDENTGSQKPTRIHYPHFSTSEMHIRAVDCIAFHNDLILSKAERDDAIVLWSITGFSPSSPPPPPLSAPTTHDAARDTRSAFTTSPIAYTRLVQFRTPDCELMCMRFGLFPGLKDGEKGAVLAMCNSYSKVFFFDLRRLEEAWEYIAGVEERFNSSPPPIQATASLSLSTTTSSGDKGAIGEVKKPKFLTHFKTRVRGGGRGGVVARLHRDTSPIDSERSTPTNPAFQSQGSSNTPQPLETGKSSEVVREEFQRSKESWSAKYGINDAERELKAHKEDVVKGFQFTGRQCAWSRGGEWCVVVGSAGILAVFERWEKK